MLLKYIKITEENVIEATKTQMTIFPNESAYYHFLSMAQEGTEYRQYYIVRDENGKNIGVTGVYYEGDINKNHSLWLGWFGVVPDERHKGYGRQILLDTIEMAKELSKKYRVKYFRLYTSERDNESAQLLYNEIMDMKEYYNNPDDINYDGTAVIFTKSLFEGLQPEKWDNIFLDLKGTEAEEMEGNEFMRGVLVKK